jgi:Fic family protein
MRQYEQTHPWLRFQLDLRSLDYSLWIALGEAQSKCEHISGVPLRPRIARELHQLFLAKGVLATTAIEGNTLTEEEVRLHLDGKLNLPPSKEYLSREIDNIVEGCGRIADHIIMQDKSQMSVEGICSFNALVLSGLPRNEDMAPGEIRSFSVGVGGYRAAPPEDCEFLLERFCEWLNDWDIPKENRIVFSLLKAIAAHVFFVWIHPFGDGNGRTARLIEFQILLAAGIPTPAAHLLSNFYNQTRSEYYRQLDRTTKTNGDISAFLSYAIRGYVDELRSQIGVIRDQQWDVGWRNYVHEMFKDRNTQTDVRRRHLVLDLSNRPEPTRISKLPEISTRLAAAYAGKTQKTLSRDVNQLEAMGLLEKSSRGVRAKREIILSFLPARKFSD